MQDFRKLLTFFEAMTKVSSGSWYPTLSLTYGTLFIIKHQLDRFKDEKTMEVKRIFFFGLFHIALDNFVVLSDRRRSILLANFAPGIVRAPGL